MRKQGSKPVPGADGKGRNSGEVSGDSRGGGLEGMPNIGKSRVSAIAVVLPLFFLSGASSLIFQNLWMRSLVIAFGSSHFATSTVLATFMGGLALGSFLAGSYVDRIKDGTKLVGLYGGLQGIIGVYGLALPLLLALLDRFNVFVWNHWNPSFYSFSLLRFVVVVGLLLVPTTCMGATLPILSKYVCDSRNELGKQAGTLEAVNTFGAVIGTFAGGFLLMPFLGMSFTNYTACGINIFLFLASLLLMKSSFVRNRSFSSSRETAQVVHENAGDSGSVTEGVAEAIASKREAHLIDEGAGDSEPLGSQDGISNDNNDNSYNNNVNYVAPVGRAEGEFQAKLAVMGIAVSGGVDMVYQLAWTRTLSMILGSSVYAFTLILLCFLLGLAAGGGLYARRSASRVGQVANLSVIHVVIGLSALIGLLLTDQLPPTFLVLMRLLRLHPTSAFVSKFVVSAALILVPTFFMGMIFPATIKVATESGKELGWTVGAVYSLDTIGSIFGSFIGGFILIPYLGIQLTISFMILTNIVLAMVFGGLNKTSGTKGKIARLVAGGGVAVGLAVLYTPWNLNVMISGVFRVSVYDVAQKNIERRKASRAMEFRKTPEWERWSNRAGANIKGLRGEPTTEEPLVDSELVYYNEGVITTVSMTRSIYEGLAGAKCWETISLQINGKADASVTGGFRRRPGEKCDALVRDPGAFGPPVGVSIYGDTETQIMSGILGVMLSNPEKPLKYSNIVGWGSGITVGSAAMTPLKEVEAVELEREVVVGARWFARYNHDAENHPKVKLIEGDGRTFLSASQKRYDLIVSEPSNPWITGCSNLFTVEYFKLVRSRLKEDGKFIQWLQIYEISPRNVKVILKTISSVFPEVQIFRPGFSPADLLLVAGKRPIVFDYEWLQRWLKTPGTGGEARRIGIREPEDIFVRFLLDSKGLRRYVKGASLNTDDNALVEFSAPKDLINYYKYDPQEIADSLNAEARPLKELVRNQPHDFEVRLAGAWLRAGFVKKALSLVQGKNDLEAARMRRIGELMRDATFKKEDVESLVKADPEMISEIKKLLESPQDDGLKKALESPILLQNKTLGFAVIGYFLSQNGQLGDALRFLWAAWESSPESVRAEVGKLLLGWTREMGLSSLSWKVGRALIEG